MCNYEEVFRRESRALFPRPSTVFLDSLVVGGSGQRRPGQLARVRSWKAVDVSREWKEKERRGDAAEHSLYRATHIGQYREIYAVGLTFAIEMRARLAHDKKNELNGDERLEKSTPLSARNTRETSTR